MELEPFPFHYRNKLFQLYTEYDLTFKEVRALIDELLEMDAFNMDRNGEEEWIPYQIEYKDHFYEVWVSFPGIVISKKRPIE